MQASWGYRKRFSLPVLAFPSFPVRVCKQPELPFGAYVKSNVKTEYNTGESIRLDCKKGFKKIGTPSRFCISGRWTAFPFECKGALLKVSHVKTVLLVKISFKFLITSSLTVSCVLVPSSHLNLVKAKIHSLTFLTVVASRSSNTFLVEEQSALLEPGVLLNVPQAIPLGVPRDTSVFVTASAGTVVLNKVSRSEYLRHSPPPSLPCLVLPQDSVCFHYCTYPSCRRSAVSCAKSS